MKKSQFTDSKIGEILKGANAGVMVKDICRMHTNSDATNYNLKTKYGGMEVSDFKRMTL